MCRLLRDYLAQEAFLLLSPIAPPPEDIRISQPAQQTRRQSSSLLQNN
jgi:hypothetical protein